MAKYYFSETAQTDECYEIDYFYDYMEDEGLDSLVITEAVKDKNSEYFYCKSFHEVSTKGECGKICSKYDPRNKVRGMCKHYAPVYDNSGKDITIFRESK